MAASRPKGWPASSLAAARCQAGGVGPDLHVGDLEGDGLEAAIGWPKAWRSRAYLAHSSTQPWQRPVARAATAMRPSSRVRRKLAEAGAALAQGVGHRTLAPSKTSSRVSEACQPTLA